MAQHFGVRPGCLQSALDASDIHLRELAQRLLHNDDPGLAHLLEQDPIGFVGGSEGQYSIERLELFTADLRQDVRKAACDKLKALRPREKFPNCN